MSRIQLARLDLAPDSAFPPVERALREPDGLLAYGGDLSLTRLLTAYSHGIFPWYSSGQPILWWSPDPRYVIAPAQLHTARRLRRFWRSCDWRISIDQAFAEVIQHCARTPRKGQSGTWILAEMITAYRQLHQAGYAHSVEVWEGNTLVGGIYGVGIGRMFFGESMFSLRSGGSKTALAALCRALVLRQVVLLDGQVVSDHLQRLGFQTIPRAAFLTHCEHHCQPIRTIDFATLPVAELQPAALAQR